MIAISIGNFDAVHLGHLALVHAARTAVGKEGEVALWCFDPSPVSVLRPEIHIDRVTTFTQRQNLLIDAGADVVLRIEPTAELLALNPEDYISQIADEYSPNFIVEGEGFRFGYQRKGTNDTLRNLGHKHQFEFLEVGGVSVSLKGGNKVIASSSIVRSLLNEGRVEDVARMLGREYCVSGVVIQGDQRGRELGVPTANMGNVETMLPRDGIYAGRAFVDDTLYVAAISIGTKPTFGEHARICEVHLIGFEGEIGAYNWPLRVTFSHLIREQKKFDSIKSLTIAIEQDIQTSIKLIESTV